MPCGILSVINDKVKNKAVKDIKMRRWGIKEGLFEEVRSKPTDEHEMRAHASPRAREGHDQDRELSAQMQGGRKERG